MKRRKFRLLLGAASLVGIAPLIILAIQNPGNRAAISPHHADARLRTRHYAAASDEILNAVQKIVPQLRSYGRHWRIVSTRNDEGKTVIHCEVPVLIFTDDLHIEIEAASDASTQLNVVSQSRVGRSDLGENRRHVLQFLAEIDKHMASLGRQS